MRDLLEFLVRERASELRITDGSRPVVIKDGKKLALDLLEVTRDELSELLNNLATQEQMEELRRCGDLHFIHVFQNSTKFSVNASLDTRSLSIQVKNLGL